METVKYIIVGAGLAGLTLAKKLSEKSISFKIIGDTYNHSSLVAAGVINPIVFRRTTKSWRVDDFIPVAKTFYQKIEVELDTKIYNEITIRRAFAHEMERKDWLKRQSNCEYDSFLNELTEEDNQFSNVKNTFGTGRVKQSANIIVENYIYGLRKFFQERESYLEEKFDYEKIDLKQKTYNDINFEKIIFCEGFEVIKNPWFSYLPMKLTKGELLQIQSNQIHSEESLNRKCFVLPVGENQFKVGSTYAWDDLSLERTEFAKNLISDNLKNLTEASFQIVNHYVGIRPTVYDRRPIMGFHPKEKSLGVFNGLGAKGYMMAPLLADEFVLFLEENTELNTEVSIDRFESFFNQ